MKKLMMPKITTPNKTPEYKNVGKEPVGQLLKKSMPEYMIPTKRLATILGLVFLAVIALAVVQLPYDDLFARGLTIEVGYPLPFLVFEIDAVEELPLKPINFIIDLMLYLVVSYIIDVLLSFIGHANKTRTRQQEGKGAKVYEQPVKK